MPLVEDSEREPLDPAERVEVLAALGVPVGLRCPERERARRNGCRLAFGDLDLDEDIELCMCSRKCCLCCAGGGGGLLGGQHVFSIDLSMGTGRAGDSAELARPGRFECPERKDLTIPKIDTWKEAVISP